MVVWIHLNVAIQIVTGADKMKEINHELSQEDVTRLKFGKPLKLISELGIINLIVKNE